MRAFIVGCGRVGAGLAEVLDRAGHEVTIMDTDNEAFTRLDQAFGGRALRGDGTDEDVLRRAGAADADVFMSLTEGDNRNILAAQLAAETLKVARVVAKVNDPVRAQAYASLGIATLCRTRMLVDALATHLGLPSDPGAQGVDVATGQHHARGEDHVPVGSATAGGSPGTAPGDALLERPAISTGAREV